jgi:hypothetical protein
MGVFVEPLGDFGGFPFGIIFSVESVWYGALY